MLEGRLIEISLVGGTMQVWYVEDASREEFWRPLLWDLVIYELLVSLNNEGYYTQEYVCRWYYNIDNGEKCGTISELMLRALKTTKEWSW